MLTPEEITKAREAYLNGTQARDQYGDRLWWIGDRDYWKPEPDYPFKLWECQTAEGPTISAMLDLVTGKPTIQVNDGSPERSDDCAARFVLNMEWSDFCYGWTLLGESLENAR